MRTLTDSGRVRIHSRLSEIGERRLADDVLDGLTKPFKEIPPKHFYDARGSELFERICQLPEYYPTRTERLILEQSADEIAEETGAGELVELGSGSAEKARILLDGMDRAGTSAGMCRWMSPSRRCAMPPASSWPSTTSWR